MLECTSPHSDTDNSSHRGSFPHFSTKDTRPSPVAISPPWRSPRRERAASILCSTFFDAFKWVLGIPKPSRFSCRKRGGLFVGFYARQDSALMEINTSGRADARQAAGARDCPRHCYSLSRSQAGNAGL